MSHSLTITLLIENTVSEAGLFAEHGLAYWIEYGDKKILFDTGQTDIIIHNATTLGVKLTDTDAIVLSHGHYDHVGGLAPVLDIAKKAKIYMHPKAMDQKFSKKNYGAKSIGMSEFVKKLVRNREIIWTEKPTAIYPGLNVTGQVPRINNFEDVGGDFYLDKNLSKPDKLLDDQSLFIETAKGLVIILGCAHAGVVNIMHRIADLNQSKTFYAVLGGMHLLRASKERIERTVKVFQEYNLQRIGPGHCTGDEVTRKFWNNFPEQCFACSVGTKIEF